ncbi:MAG TPA: hypothetical protein VG935_02015 [Patescibacteria group bacterium]|nr:hypothetical protein [Patescibacteria group bacterium]
MARSRVNQRLAKQTERNLFLIIGIVIIGVVLFLFFGAKLLVNFSLFVEKKSDASSQTSSADSFISIPVLNPIDSSTNSASLDISGIAEDGSYIKLYLNGEMIKKADIKAGKSFVVHDVELTTGENDFKAKAFSDNGKESSFSEQVSITYSNKAPSLSIDFPSDGQTYHKDNNPIKVSGKTDPNIHVTVNDFWAIVDDQGNYSYNLPLKDGDNEIKVDATDDAGNKTEKTIHINYSE